MSKLFLFDLDGVIFDSKKNMEKSWSEVNRKLKYNISFNKYFNEIGIPFENILKKLGINKKIKLAKKIFRNTSNKNIDLVRLYPGAKETIKELKNKGIKIGIITSKEFSRANRLLKKFKISVLTIQCPKKGIRGKPNPDLLIRALKSIKEKKKNTYYIGDTFIDYKFARNAKINFIFANYGYGKVSNKSIIRIKKISDLLLLASNI